MFGEVRGALSQCYYFFGAPFAQAWVLATTRGAAAARAGVMRHSRRSLSLAGIDVELRGQENLPEGGWVVTYNEPSLADTIAFNACMWDLIERVSAAELYGYLPPGKAFARRAGILLVPRGDRAGTERLLAETVEEARAGVHVGWSGEGRLSGRDRVCHFKRGGALIAIRAGVPLVPMAIRGGYHLMPTGSLRARPGTVRLRIGRPLATDGLTDDDARDLVDRAQQAVADLFGTIGPPPDPDRS